MQAVTLCWCKGSTFLTSSRAASNLVAGTGWWPLLDPNSGGWVGVSGGRKLQKPALKPPLHQLQVQKLCRDSAVEAVFCKVNIRCGYHHTQVSATACCCLLGIALPQIHHVLGFLHGTGGCFMSRVHLAHAAGIFAGKCNINKSSFNGPECQTKQK